MKRLVPLLWLAIAAGLGAQQPTDSGSAPRRDAQDLIRQIEQRFHERVRNRLGLTDEQDAKLMATEQRIRARRQVLLARQRAIEEGLDDQMRPGVAANPDSVRRLMDARQTLRADRLKLDEEEDREMAGYLSPVQRAQFQQMRENFRVRLQQLRQARRARGLGPMGQGPRRWRRPPE
jgi:Spy/CpxP family protein refolding chaperone